MLRKLVSVSGVCGVVGIGVRGENGLVLVMLLLVVGPFTCMLTMDTRIFMK